MVVQPGATRHDLSAALDGREAAAVTDAVPSVVLQAEVRALPQHQRLAEDRHLHVFCSPAEQIPHVLQEIGRLRELTFRHAGSGTGNSTDLDPFDACYHHLFLWDNRAGLVAGAYRLGVVPEVWARRGRKGLYTQTLFEFGPGALDALSTGLELGRSWIRVDYQRSFAPLLLLWRGITRFVRRSPQSCCLFGAVSVSNSYSMVSRQIIVDYLSAHAADASLVSQVRPYRPYHCREASGWNTMWSPPRNINELSRLIARIEPDRKGVPVLLRHYLRIGGRVLGFALDRNFGESLDSLVMVDLRQIDPARLARYARSSAAVPKPVAPLDDH